MVIVTLIAANGLHEIDVWRVIDCVRLHRFETQGWRWLDERQAADVELKAREPDLPELRRVIESNFSGFGIDVVAQPKVRREKKLFVADMDSTIIGQECIDELADFAGLKPQVAAITERAMRGELDFAAALNERVALLEGLDEGVIHRCLAERIRPNPGAATLVRTLRAHGAETILVSGGFTAFVAPIAEAVGFERYEANVLGVDRGRLTGRVEGPVVDAAAKRRALVEARDRLGLAKEESLAVGDGANDIGMIEEAGLGVAFRAKPALSSVADARLDHHGLDSLLWAQGIARQDWIEG